MYNIYQLQDFAKKFLKDTYDLELIVPLKLNGRMKTTCGWFRWNKRTRRPVVVELNRFFVENNNSDVVIDVLKHELIHYALFMKGIPHSDGQYEFEQELKRLGVVSQKTIDKYDITSKPRNLHYYRCQESSCNKEYRLKRALKNQGRNHRCNCGGSLIDLGKKVVAS
jgi:SprT-like protein